MKQDTKARLSQTPEGQAIIDVMEHVGGWDAFIAATGISRVDLNNYYRRGKFSQFAAYRIEQTPYFAEAGWTKEKCLPSLTPFQWKPFDVWVARRKV